MCLLFFVFFLMFFFRGFKILSFDHYTIANFTLEF